MTDTPATAMTFLKSLLEFLTRIATGRQSELQVIGELADKKFGDIDAAHTLFMSVIDEFTDRLKQARENARDLETNPKLIPNEIHKIIDTVTSAMSKMASERRKAMDKRRSAYEEARAYESISFDKGLIKKIPTEIIDLSRDFMKNYCNYFEWDNKYHHSLARLLEEVERILSSIIDQRQGIRTPRAIRAVRGSLLTAIEYSESASGTARKEWAEVSSSYYKLKRELIERKFLI